MSRRQVGLQVSGHVHAGQSFPLHPAVWLVNSGRFAGLYKEKESYLYVSSGQSNWGPRTRLYTSPEATVIILRHAATFEAEGRTVDLSWRSETWWAVAGLLMLPAWAVSLVVTCMMERQQAAWWVVASAKKQAEEQEAGAGSAAAAAVFPAAGV